MKYLRITLTRRSNLKFFTREAQMSKLKNDNMYLIISGKGVRWYQFCDYYIYSTYNTYITHENLSVYIYDFK